MPETTPAAHILTAWRQHQRFVLLRRSDIPERKRHTAVLFRCGSHLIEPRAEDAHRVAQAAEQASAMPLVSSKRVDVLGDYHSGIEVYPKGAAPKPEDFVPWMARVLWMDEAIVRLDSNAAAKILEAGDIELKWLSLSRLDMALAVLDKFETRLGGFPFSKRGLAYKVKSLETLVNSYGYGSVFGFSPLCPSLTDDDAVTVGFLKEKIGAARPQYQQLRKKMGDSTEKNLRRRKKFPPILAEDILWQLLYNTELYSSLAFSTFMEEKFQKASFLGNHMEQFKFMMLRCVLTFLEREVRSFESKALLEMLADASYLQGDVEGPSLARQMLSRFTA